MLKTHIDNQIYIHVLLNNEISLQKLHLLILNNQQIKLLILSDTIFIEYFSPFAQRTLRNMIKAARSPEAGV